jgi:hypothetical protein
MKLLQIFWIHILGLVLFLLFDVFLFVFLNIEILSVSYLLCFFSYWFALLVLVRIAPNRWFQVEPTKNWSDAIQQKNTVLLLLGFGYNKSKNRIMLPGEANEELFKWAIENTKSELYLVQEGFWGIKYPDAINTFSECQDSMQDSMQERWELTRPPKYNGDKVLICRIHPHDPNDYVDTPDAIERAFELLLMEKIEKDAIILIAHPMQLWRTRADCELLKREKDVYERFTLVVPEIKDIPYPKNPPFSQIHTRWLFYKIFEVLISRPKDYLKLKLKYCKIKRKLNQKRN